MLANFLAWVLNSVYPKAEFVTGGERQVEKSSLDVTVLEPETSGIEGWCLPPDTLS
jgi:hypothetical protein